METEKKMPGATSEDSLFMNRCIQLALNGKQTCSPNPMVGAVVVHQGKIIGEGWHRKAGEPHAEPHAIRSVKDKRLLKESTLYVSLEPCSHYGKTPPCVELIIREGIPRVVIGMLDPFPLVSGRGVSRLLAEGVEVLVGIEEESCKQLNRYYLKYLLEKRPWIVLKWAQTADGFMDRHRDSGVQEHALQISTAFTQILTHKLRSDCDAIMVGTNTVLKDNPNLNVRYWTGKNPVRIVLDRRGVVSADYNVLNGRQQTIVFSGSRSGRAGNTLWIKDSFEEGFLSRLMTELHCLKIQSVLVEGGSLLHQSLLREGLWDEIQIETSTQILGSGVAAPDLKDLNISSCHTLTFGDSDGKRILQWIENV